MKLYIKYQRPGPSGFSQEDFKRDFPMLVYVKHVGPWVGPFLDKGYNLNILGRSPLDEVTYQRPGHSGFSEDL